MKNKTIIKWGAFAVAIALAAMGCWFCWNCPMDWLYGEGQHSVFMRQVVWNAMGLFLVMIIIPLFCSGFASNPDVAGQVISGIIMGIGSGLSGL